MTFHLSSSGVSKPSSRKRLRRRNRSGPPKRVAFALRHFDLAEKRVLDVGCAEGGHLMHFGPDSVGLELRNESITRARSRGLDVRPWNFENGFSEELGMFDAIWCSNLLEHVLSPHLFLTDARKVLRKDGLFIGVVPVTRRSSIGPWRGFLAADHVGFFNPITLRLTVERAGYEILFLGSSSLPSAPRALARVLSSISPNVLFAGRPIQGFQYPEKSYKQFIGDKVAFKK